MAGAPAIAQSADVPLLQCSGLPCVEVTVAGGKPLKLLIDTGDASSVLDRSVAEKLGLHLELLGQNSQNSQATLPGLRIGNVSLGDQQVIVMNLGAFITKGVMPPADGALAYPAFKNRAVTMDYRKHRLRISPPLTGDEVCSGVCGEIAYPTFGKNGPPIVTSTEFRVNNKPVTVQIDTLYAGTMLIYPTSVAKLGLEAQSASPKQQNFPYTDGGVAMIEGIASAEGFGEHVLLRNAPLYFATPEVHLPDGMFDGTVGDALFRSHVLTFDFRANRFRLN